VSVGLLGADFASENGRYRIKANLHRRELEPRPASPLSAPGIQVADGDYLLERNGPAARAARQSLQSVRGDRRTPNADSSQQDSLDGRVTRRDRNPCPERRRSSNAGVGEDNRR